VNRYITLGASFAIAVVLASLAAGPYRRGALIGALGSGASGLASLVFMRRSARAAKPLRAALLVMALMFLARIGLVAASTVAVVRSRASITAFILAFFVTYFGFTAIESAYLGALARPPGKST
jgi:hypothetical protein